ncbi:unnamed protein product [Phytomonas sp. EM1]|nr:unnamed protein product [Phytomonas sp. EM1]|eukprot:CCW63507.1 unnamed protein product [Phytomonas sp. isolate EM1]
MTTPVTKEASTKELPEVTYHTPFPMAGEACVEGGMVYRLAGRREALLFRRYADDLDGFTLRHNNHETLVWEKRLPNEASHLIKVFSIFHDATPGELYDLMQDAVFREEWDTFRLEAYRVARLDAANDIGYYAARSPLPFVANRDFVNQRMWHDAGRGEYVIFNTSVPHPAVPPGERCVRAVSMLTGYFFQPWVNPRTGEVDGTAFTYLTHVDPRGSIPKTLMNYVTTKFAPKTIKKVGKALKRFKVWLPAQLEAGGYVRDWVKEPEWWVSPEEEAANPIRNITIDFAKEKMKGIVN